MAAWFEGLGPCGPVLDGPAAERAREILEPVALAGGWETALRSAWPLLQPIVSASPYLRGLAVRRPEGLDKALAQAPRARLAEVLSQTRALSEAASEEAAKRLRGLKSELHLAAALADLSGAWGLKETTFALSAFAETAVQAALAICARDALQEGLTTAIGEGEAGPLPGLFVIAMGKLGASELNYSSDIDISVFYEPTALPLAAGREPERFAVRFVEKMADLLRRRTAEGYVFRVDLRLRPDPATTPTAAPVAAALDYYESVGQNWERAAFIKARPIAGDLASARGFLAALEPFVWRRNLDYDAIADIHSIKRQIHAHKVDERLSARGADIKLGRGGIREIEFWVQTQQLILGGRRPALRAAPTLDALGALAREGHVGAEVAAELAEAYVRLRNLEHRIQMVNDEQTHRLPEADAERWRVAALSGASSLKRFDAAISALLKQVNARFGELFAGEEALSSRFGSLVFTGVEDDPETLATLARMGFGEPAKVAEAVRAWHHGGLPAARSERGRERLTRLVPRLLDAAAASGAPDAAFERASIFLGALTPGTQALAMFLAQPRLLSLVVKAMAFAPSLALGLARRPAALDALVDPAFFEDLSGVASLAPRLCGPDHFEEAMNRARRVHREEALRIAVHLLGALASPEAAARAYSDLAEAIIAALSKAALLEAERIAGRLDGEVAVIALGTCGAREMTASSDLDLMTLYRASNPEAVSATKGWSPETFYARFTQRLVAALSAPTAEGGLYETDLQLRPSGTKGPVAVSIAAFQSYYAGEAEVWELMAMTRSRLIWASSPAFEEEAKGAIETALRRPREASFIAGEVRSMRELLRRERPSSGFWDMKLSDGALVEIEFAAQL
ncbi:MAG: bifunctional [glutamine synthetase] adenylyltransferase/[glutamine synthetase]-adenylyl-L-tyrosine phosphorylase, partial [Caulobacteraceae bacterium]